MASGEEVVSKPSTLQEKPVKILTTTVGVAESSKRNVTNGQIRLFGRGRSRSSSGSTGLRGKDAWMRAELYLTETTICYNIEDFGTCEMLLEDVIGIQLTKTPPASNPRACEFSIYLYPVDNPQAKIKSRLQRTVVIHFDSSEKFEDNFESASKWKTATLLQTQKVVRASFGEDKNYHSSSHDVSVNQEGSTLVPRKLLIFINPVAGTKKSESVFKQCVQPMLDLADIQYIVEVTKHRKHAQELIKTYDLSEIDGIVISSGDGMINEVINGIMERADWDEVIKIPIGVIPTGSANCSCAYTFVESGEKMSVEAATFQLIRGGVVSADLSTIQLSDGTSTYFLVLATWGFLSDFATEAEKFRKFGLGYTRYYLASVSVIAKLKLYRGKLSYLPADQKMLPQHDASDSVHEDSVGDAPTNGSGGANLKDAALSTGSRDNATALPTNLLVPLTEPVPDTWVTKKGDFHQVGAALRTMYSLPILGFFVDPSIPLENGSMRLMWTGDMFSRSTAAKIISGSPEIATTDESKFVRVNVKAFRLEPETAPGRITVDGELVPYGPIQGQVHQGLIRVMSRKRKT